MREPGAAASADADSVEALHAAIGRFARLDAQLGSGAVAPSVLRSFRAAQQVLRTGRYVRAVRRDLQAVTAEMGELAGWMLFDGLRLTQARRINAEALLLARAAGDTAMTWFVLSNEALVCTGSGHYGEALRISRHFAEDPRVPRRVRALLIITPQEGSSWTPMPRKEMNTSVATADGKRIESWMSATWATLGRMWRNKIQRCE